MKTRTWGWVLLVALVLCLPIPLTWAQNSAGGAFLPGFNYVIGGQWRWRGQASPFIFEGTTDNEFETTLTVTDPTADRTWTIPNAASDTFVGRATTDTFTNNTLTAPTINAATLTGVVTFGTTPTGVRQRARSPSQNVDNGAGTTVDHVIIVPQQAITITGARVVYTDETAGTIAAGTWQLGTTVGGAGIVAAVAYTNAATVGTETVGTIAAGAVTAGTPVIFRHTGVAAVAAGVVYVEIDFDED